MAKRVIFAGLVVFLAAVGFWAFREGNRNVPHEALSEASTVVPHRKQVAPMTGRRMGNGGTGEEAFGARIERFLNDEAAQEAFRLNPAELADYLERNRSNASSLLIAFEASRDREFIRRAAQTFPEDPFVQAKVLAHDVFPEARGEWGARFKASAPENSYPHLLAARELMKNGDSNGALEEIVKGREKKYDDYTRETMAGLEEAYVLAGRPIAEAMAFGSADVLLPQLAPFKKLGMDLRDAANRYAQEGDSAAQTALLQGAWIIGSQLRESGEHGVLLDELVGLAIQNISLGSWPGGVSASFIERPVADELARNSEFRQQTRTGAATLNGWRSSASENEVIAYYKRLQMFGERNAMEWLMRLHPEFVPQGTIISGK